MKQLKTVLLFIFSAMVFVSCGKYSDGESVWAKGAWLVPWALGLGAIGFALYGFKRWKSGTVIGGSTNDPKIRDAAGNIQWYKITQFIWAILLIVILIIVLIVQNSEK